MSPHVVRPVFVLATALAILLVSPAQARDGWFGSARPGSKAVFYGEVPRPGERANDETIYLSLDCAGKGRGVAISVSETSKKLKPGRKVRVVVSAAGVRSTAIGKTQTNELAGVPGLEVILPAHARVFAAMRQTATLRISAGGWREATPLRGIGNRLKVLLAACRAKASAQPLFSAYPDAFTLRAGRWPRCRRLALVVTAGR